MSIEWRGRVFFAGKSGVAILRCSPTPSGLIQVTLGVTHRTLINSEMRPCEIDPEYSVVKCMEDYSTVTAGCKSPWDLHKNDSVSKITFTVCREASQHYHRRKKSPFTIVTFHF